MNRIWTAWIYRNAHRTQILKHLRIRCIWEAPTLDVELFGLLLRVWMPSFFILIGLLTCNDNWTRIFQIIIHSVSRNDLILSSVHVTDSISYIYKRFCCYYALSIREEKKINFSPMSTPKSRYQKQVRLAYLRLQSDGLSVHYHFFIQQKLSTPVIILLS